MSWVSSWIDSLANWWKSMWSDDGDPDPTPGPTPEPDPQPTPSGELWLCYPAPEFFQHGTSSENEYRQAAIDAARESGCILCNASFGMDNELAMHLLALEHPDRPGYYLEGDGWFFKAQRANVPKWVHYLGAPALADAKRWCWLTKSTKYSGRLQYLMLPSTGKDVVDFVRAEAAKNGAEVVVQ